MVTYEYICRCCGFCFEAQQRITDEPLRDCPRCLVASLQRLVSGGAGVVFQGGGWAKDLYSKPPASGDK
jgi:putative FmdB family regulatory protein